MKKEYIGVVAGKSGEAITKELQKWGVNVALVAGKKYEMGVDIAESCICTDLSHKQEIHGFFKSKDVNKVIFATGHILAFELAEFLANQGILINIIPEVSMLCNDKYKLKKIAEQIGFKTPRYSLIKDDSNLDEVLSDWDFPLVLKSIKDYVTPKLIHSKEDLKRTLDDLFLKEPTVMIEEYINGNDCSVVVSNSGTNVIAMGVLYWSKAREDKLEGFFESFSEPLSYELEKKVKMISCELIQQINVMGLPRVDIIVKNDVPYILEVNSVIYSGNSGMFYTISSRKNGINAAKIIVMNAMSYFSEKTSVHYNKMENVLIFADDISNDNKVKGDIDDSRTREVIYGVPSVPEDYLYPDVFDDIDKFLFLEKMQVNSSEKQILTKYISCINIKNPDYVANCCKGDLMKLVEAAIKYLHSSKIEFDL